MCLEVREEPCWGPGERSILGVLPGLEMRLPEGGQDRGRTDVSKALPEATLAPVNQFSNQSHNSIPSSECSGSQIRPWKSGSMWTPRRGRFLRPLIQPPPPAPNHREAIACQHEGVALYFLLS